MTLSDKMPLNGDITTILSQVNRDKRYSLTEDDDFMYLHIPGEVCPIVFSVKTNSIYNVEVYITEYEKRKK